MKKYIRLSVVLTGAVFAAETKTDKPVATVTPAPVGASSQPFGSQMTPFGVSNDDYRKAMQFRAKMERHPEIQALLQETRKLQEKIEDIVLQKSEAEPEIKGILLKIKAKREEMKNRLVAPIVAPSAPPVQEPASPAPTK